jgi:hypothetical protein
MPPDGLAKMLDVSKTQLNRWLKQAVEDKKVNKMNKPVRYFGFVRIFLLTQSHRCHNFIRVFGERGRHHIEQ